MKKNNINNEKIDLLKYFFSLCVVAIHIHPINGDSSSILFRIYLSILELAVPFFLCCTGYFIQNKMLKNNDELDVLKGTIKKYLKIYIKYTLIYMPFTFYFYITNRESLIHNIFDFFRGLFIVGEHFNSWILWYILAILYSLSIMYILVKYKFKKSTIFSISLIMYFFGIVIDFCINKSIALYGINLFSILKKIFVSGRIFKCMLYILIGMLICQKHLKAKKYYLISFFLIIVLTSFFEIDMSFITIPISTYLVFVISVNDKINLNFQTKYIRKISQNMYFWHLYVWGAISLVFYNKFVYGIYMYIFVIIIINILSILKIFINNKNN